MKSFNVVVTVSTTICVDANTPEDAIKKVQKALSSKTKHPAPSGVIRATVAC